MSGPLPKKPSTRQRRNKTATGRTFEPGAPFEVPELPEGYDKRTLRWWETVKTSPMRDEYEEADWQGLLLVAATLNSFWFGGDPKFAAEYRMQCREYGLTPMARRSLQWEIARGEEAQRRMSRTQDTPRSDPRLRLLKGDSGTPDTGSQPQEALPDARTGSL